MKLITDNSQFIKFIIVAGTYNLITYLLYAGLVFANFNYLFASTVSYLLGTIISYFMNNALVFTNSSSDHKTIFYYFIYYILLLLVNLVMLHVFVDWLKVNSYVAQIFVTGITAIISYHVVRTLFLRGSSGIFNAITARKP
ncbi:GtrA-like protein [Legionella beliardensis]|uniref:GtrA-like protein n=1 Tax=Legionella beliardensis TaxID=91822 RepID=A0A378I432_9GAMM|nr:GtrA family protein [Legionella beliardensis]STX29753.1 GtrA-like protein [Legionella beliardensis]